MPCPASPNDRHKWYKENCGYCKGHKKKFRCNKPREGARYVNVGHARLSNLHRLVLDVVQDHPGCTSNFVSTKINYPKIQVQSRLQELRVKGLIIEHISMSKDGVVLGRTWST